MIRFVHLNYHCHQDMIDPAAVIQLHQPTSGFTRSLSEQVSFFSIKHMAGKAEWESDGLSYFFFRKGNRSWSLPFSTHKKIRSISPDVVMAEGFVFPLQLILLRFQLGRGCRLLAQHHGERPWSGWKKLLQKMADPFIDGYLFSSIDNAASWLDQKIISRREKCFEVLSASTGMRQRNRKESRDEYGITGTYNFIWVGRLIDIKDPLTILKGFKMLADARPDARLRMVYQDETLLPEVKQFIKDGGLENKIILLGKKKPEELEVLYSASDYFLAGSHREGSGYALVEAMSCGCIPIVTDIPSFRMITAQGKRGYLFPPGQSGALGNLLLQLWPGRKEGLSRLVRLHALTKLSSSFISRQILSVCQALGAE